MDDSTQDHFVKEAGVAVYFALNGTEHCIPCDKWSTIGDNTHAINKTVHALRGLERWGAREMTETAMRGFSALPPPRPRKKKASAPKQPRIEEHRYFDACLSNPEVRARYKALAKTMHPDIGGDKHSFTQMSKQYKEALERVS